MKFWGFEDSVLRRFFGEQNERVLLEVNDLSAAVLAGDGQARFAAGQRFGDFGEHFLRGVIGLA
jgi:hypothetical protein